jgi:hypothetical protein
MLVIRTMHLGRSPQRTTQALLLGRKKHEVWSPIIQVKG